MISVTVDTREPKFIQKRFEGLTKDLKDLDVIIEKLDEGDYRTDHYLIERKDLDDLIGSLVEGRLEDQIERLTRTDYKYKVLMVTMHHLQDKYSQIHENSINGWLASLKAQYGFELWVFPYDFDWMDFIYRLELKEQKYNVEKKQEDNIAKKE